MREGELKYQHYEDWMLPQVGELFAAQYERTAEEESDSITKFFDHPFQREQSLRFVALDGETVAGFQSFFYWPYRLDGQTLRSYQSGRSLVSPDYRGRGVFQNLLNAVDNMPLDTTPDLLMGFPVEQSFGSFMRNEWLNPLDLSWHVKVVNPVSLLRPKELDAVAHAFDGAPELVDRAEPAGVLTLSSDADFIEWRSSVLRNGPYQYFHFSAGSNSARVDMKFNRRGRFLELVIGDWRATTQDPKFAQSTVKALVRQARSYRFVTMIACALNSASKDVVWTDALKQSGFRKIRPKIYFITKRYQGPEAVERAASWRLTRSDIDTW